MQAWRFIKAHGPIQMCAVDMLHTGADTHPHIESETLKILYSDICKAVFLEQALNQGWAIYGPGAISGPFCVLIKTSDLEEILLIVSHEIAIFTFLLGAKLCLSSNKLILL